MKNLTLSLVLLLILSSCKNEAHKTTQENEPTELNEKSIEETDTNTAESFKSIDVTELNEKLSNQNDLDLEGVAKAYYVYDTEENMTRQINYNKQQQNITAITIIEENIPDDALLAKKTVIKVKKEGDSWTALAIKEAWKCRRNAQDTQQNWTITNCK